MTSAEVFRPEIPAEFERYRDFLTSNCRRTTMLRLTGVAVEDTSVDTLTATASLTGSRIGGPALITKNHPWPTDKQGKKMMLLAQLNLAELPARPGYPTEGMLQFFHGDDDCYGFESGHHVRYISAAELAAGHLEGTLKNQTDALWGGYFEVHGQLFDQFPTSEDYEVEDLTLPTELATEETEDALYDVLGLNPTNTIFGGGWAYFTQGDPRTDLSEEAAAAGEEKYELLLQVDTEDSADSQVTIMFGDSGIANFFIKPSDLAALNFDNVLYTWDCC